jgi:hypothetical protein
METLHMIVQQGYCPHASDHPVLLASRFYLARASLSFINAVLNATSKELKRHPSFNLLEEVMVRRLLKLPI